MIIETIVAEVFDLDPGKVTDGMSKENLEAWDSMAHLTLIMSLEHRLNISISIDDAMDMTDVATIKAILKHYGVTSGNGRAFGEREP